MKVADLQPSIVQLANVQRDAQAQATGAQIAQQAFAQQMERLAALRPEQVQAAPPGSGAHAAGVRPDEHGERDRRRPAPAGRRGAPRGTGAEPVASGDVHRLDVRI